MALWQRFLDYLKTLNPDAYPKLCAEMSFGKAFLQFLFSFAMLFAVMSLLFIPAVILGAPELQSSVNGFDTFVLGGDFSTSHRIELFDQPRIAVDLRENATMDGEQLLVTRDGVVWNRWYFFGQAQKPWTEIKDAKSASEGFYLGLLVFLLPALAFWTGIYLLVKYLLIIFVLGLVGFLIPRLLRFSIGFADTMKVSLFAATLMASVEMALFPFWRNAWLPLSLYLLFLIIGIVLVGDRRLSDGGKHPAKKTGHHEIWNEKK